MYNKMAVESLNGPMKILGLITAPGAALPKFPRQNETVMALILFTLFSLMLCMIPVIHLLCLLSTKLNGTW